MKEILSILGQLAESLEGKIYRNYSGRGMYGALCVGLVCHDFKAGLMEAGKKNLPIPLIDNMGKDYILYWPEFKEPIT